MLKCPECKFKIPTIENCQLCFLAEQKRRISIERKYIATLNRTEKFYAEAKNIMNGKIK